MKKGVLTIDWVVDGEDGEVCERSCLTTMHEGPETIWFFTTALRALLQTAGYGESLLEEALPKQQGFLPEDDPEELCRELNERDLGLSDYIAGRQR